MESNTIVILLSAGMTILAILLFLSVYYLYKFAKIIMVFEDDLSEAIEELNKTEDRINNVIKMPLFFDSPEVKEETNRILEQIRLCRFSVQKIIERFTERSKRKYITIVEEDAFEQNNRVPQQDFEMPRLPGQPPGTPNPLEMIYEHNIYNREGTVFNVGRFKENKKNSR